MRINTSCVAARRAFAAAPLGVTGSVVILTLILCTGCGSNATAPSLDVSVANSSLITALDAWRQGHAPESLRQSSPSIIVVDPQWNDGQRLVSYRVLESSTNDGSNLHVPVELELEDGAGVRSKLTAKYTVGTSPKITVFSEEPIENL
ncbi:MAG: hypothetical protein KDB11_32545 [Planctomycetales bacterium]|nr:hypothetical protein [Planctomycetales bacterium]